LQTLRRRRAFGQRLRPTAWPGCGFWAHFRISSRGKPQHGRDFWLRLAAWSHGLAAGWRYEVPGLRTPVQHAQNCTNRLSRRAGHRRFDFVSALFLCDCGASTLAARYPSATVGSVGVRAWRKAPTPRSRMPMKTKNQSRKCPKDRAAKIGACPHFSRLQGHETAYTYKQLGSFRKMAIGFVFLGAPNSRLRPLVPRH